MTMQLFTQEVFLPKDSQPALAIHPLITISMIFHIITKQKRPYSNPTPDDDARSHSEERHTKPSEKLETTPMIKFIEAK